jgi:hypothetical protein
MHFSSNALIAAAMVTIAAGVATSPASAITFDTSSVSVTDSINGPSIQYSSNGLDRNLTVGSPFTINDFITARITGSSFSSQTGNISVTFDFSSPSGASGNTDSGSISATIVDRAHDISITWNDPITISFGNGDQLSVNLANVNFDCGSSCNQDTFNIAGTFTALAPTPLPAALPLFAGGLGALGLLGWRRKRTPRSLAV